MGAGGSGLKKLSRAVYTALKFDAPAPWEYWQVVMCERFGWTLDYWDALEPQQVYMVRAIWDGVDKAQPKGKRKER